MILVDPRIGSKDLLPILKRLGVPCEMTTLEFGDACFEGRGPEGTICVGIERKNLHDMLNSIEDNRYSGHQRIGMKQMYQVSVLMIEGHWKPHDPQGVLMEGFSGGSAWGYCRPRGQRQMYSKLYRYLMSVSLSGVMVSYSRDAFHTAYNIAEWFHYFQKSWGQHTSLKEIQKIAIPTLNHKPSLTRKWANDLDGIGTKLSEDAEKLFKTPLALATADEMQWLRIPGVGVKSAQQIVRDINGWRK